jgi:hypothetical protein
MPKEWYLEADKIEGPESGKELAGGIVRLGADGKTYEFLAVVARTEETNPDDSLQFPPFAYNGLVWHITVTPPYAPGQSEVTGHWRNNKNQPGPPAEDDGTYTGQAGPGVPEEEGNEDAASASA